MINNWKNIWNKREERLDKIDRSNQEEIFLELKRINGFDVNGGGIGYDALIEQHRDIKEKLSRYHEMTNIYDVGCGSGANLYLYGKDGLKIGGIDYSETQINIAKKVLNTFKILELDSDEAKNLPVEIVYDAIVSNSVFSYFPSEEYAMEVLKRMLQKTKYSIGLIDIHDIEKKEAFTEYRRKMIEDYDDKYKGLPKLFYRKEFFTKFAEKEGLEILFCMSDVEGYWNNDFVFDVYMYKKDGVHG